MKKVIYSLLVVAMGLMTPVASYGFEEDAFETLKKLSRATEVEVEAHLEMAQEFINGRYFKKADDYIAKARALVGGNESPQIDAVQEYLDQMRAEEKEVFDAAVAAASEDALNAYIKQYNGHKGQATYYEEAKNCIKDLKLWNVAEAQNTKQSYQSYLEQSEYKVFAGVAQEKVATFQMEEDWAGIKDGVVESEYRAFVAKYPASPYAEQAKGILAVYDAAHLCDQEQYIEAFQLFEKAKGYTGIPSHLQDEYELACHAEQYKGIANASVDEAMGYLSSFPSGMYATVASNRIAVLKADNFGGIGSTYQDAMSYAKDAATRNYVDAKANEYACKLADNFANTKGYDEAYRWSKDSETRQYVERKVKVDKDRRHYLRWHDRVTCGWEFLSDFNGEFLGAGTGLYIKFGRCTEDKSDFLNFSLGAKYTYNTYVGSDYDILSTFDLAGHQVSGVAQLRLNLFRMWTGRFYIGGAGEYSYTFSGDLDIDGLAVQGQLGYNSRHYDICFYYKQFLDYKGVECNYDSDWDLFDVNETLEDKSRIGLQMTFYF